MLPRVSALAALFVLAPAAASAQDASGLPGARSVQIHLSVHVPLRCSLRPARTSSAELSVDQRCNADHEVSLDFPPALIPADGLTVSYGGRTARLERDGRTVVWRGGMFEGLQPVRLVGASPQESAVFFSRARFSLRPL